MIVRLLAVIAVLGFLAFAAEPPGGYFKNEAWGYKVKVPRDWRQAAVGVDEARIASKHLGKRELEASQSRWWSREAPEMWVIGFPRNAAPDANAHYDTYIKEQSAFLSWSEGYDFSSKQETEVDGVKVTTYEITRKEKSDNAPRRVVTWVYHFDDMDLAVQFKILEEHFDNYEGTFEACLRSLERIKRTKAMPGAGLLGDAGAGEAAVPRTPEEQERALKDAVKQRIRQETDALHEGWSHRSLKRFLVLYNADEKFVRATSSHAEAVQDHVEKLFGSASGYTPPVILRLFATEGERDAYSKASSGDGPLGEILVAAGHGWEKDRALETLNRGIFYEWLEARNPKAKEALPDWLSTGLDKYMDMVRTKGKRITFTNEDWDRDSMRLKIKAGEYVPLRQLLTGEKDSQPEFYTQARSVGFWLMTKGNRGKYKNLVRDYLEALIAGAAPAEALDRTFQGWSEKDWEKFTDAWLSHAK